MTHATFISKSVIPVILFFFLLFSPMICLAQSDICESKPTKSSKQYQKIIRNEKSKLIEKKEKLLNHLKTTECSNSTATLDTTKSNLIEELCAVNENENKRYKLLNLYLSEECRKYKTTPQIIKSQLIIDICKINRNIEKNENFEANAIAWENGCKEEL